MLAQSFLFPLMKSPVSPGFKIAYLQYMAYTVYILYISVLVLNIYVKRAKLENLKQV